MTTALRSRALWAEGNWYRAGWYQSIVLRQRANTAVCILARYVRRAPRASTGRTVTWMACSRVEAPRRGLGRRLSNRSLRSRRTPRARPHLSPQQEIPPPIVLFLHTLASTSSHLILRVLRENAVHLSLFPSPSIYLSLSLSLSGPASSAGLPPSSSDAEDASKRLLLLLRR